ncbi:non-ribosomal peptide synthetase [Oceanicella sp. SM1341]|uniref:non-ribosomal peptide synthetase n=1 Tax=Oceanicella sp. SM1341 TaxID=1548889 RepID=UPI0018E577D1|nr:non-ribosomal peptide synthetase [Oceanicella sp. SM1341]
MTLTDPDLSSLSAAERAGLIARLRAARARPRPLSFAQQRLWLIDRLQPGNPAYAIPAAVRLRGPLDTDRLQAALAALVARHPALRTRIREAEGTPEQVVGTDAAAPLEVEAPATGSAALAARLDALAAEPFDLESGPPFRARLFRLGPQEHVFALVLHHIVADYWSLQVLLRDLLALYAGTDLPPLGVSYTDYATRQRETAATPEAQLAYWREALAGAPELLALPADFPRPKAQSFRGARHGFALDAETSAALTRLARAQGATPFMVLLAAFQLFLHRLSGQEEVCVGSAISNRDRPELHDVVGLFVNTLVFRARPDETAPFTALLGEVRTRVMQGLAHADVPFEQVIDTLGVPRSLSHNALFQALFVLHNTGAPKLSAPGLELEGLPFPNRGARFDLSLDMHEGERFTGVFEYNTDLFRAETVAHWAELFCRLISGLVRAPQAPMAGIDMLSPADHAALAADTPAPTPLPGDDVATLFERVAAARGPAEALRSGETALSYAALDRAANRLAHALAAALPEGGAQPRIAIALPRSAEMVVALLAVLKCGAAYIPLDPGHPEERLRMVLEDGGAALLLTRDAAATLPGLAADAPCPVIDLAAWEAGDAPESSPPRPHGPDRLAYAIFTSGSTGRPKGVPVRQDALVNLLTDMARRPGFGPDDTLVAVTTPAFDIATLELLMPLLAGGRVVVASSEEARDDLALAELLAHSGATHMQATPATWRLLAEGGWQAPEGFAMLCGGEALDPGLATRLLQGRGTLWNLYGPTETTIWSAAARIGPAEAAGPVPLGQPIANTELHVLDRHLRPVPAGVAGELWIGGIGLSPGYLGRPDLTGRAFRTVALPGGPRRLYRTGDAVRRLADGRLIYLGRLDFQVKLRGFRIEIGEIEAALNALPEVTQAVVALWRPAPEDEGMLVAWYSAATPVEPATLRAALAARLPGYMVPARFMALDALPLNANGKVDRKRLPSPAAAPASTPPQGAAEVRLAALWAELLGLEDVSRDGHFFDLGGHSLLATRMLARLRAESGTAPELRALFEAPVLADFAARLKPGAGTTAPDIPRLPRGRPLPLSFAQARQWALARLEPESAAYNMPVALRLGRAPDIPRLARALDRLRVRHEVLRGRYAEEAGTPVMIVEDAAPAALAAEPVEDLEQAVAAEAATPFDLAAAPPLRLRLLRDREGAHALTLTLHHIAGDALTLELLGRELAILCADPEATLPELPLQYADFAAWQRAQDLREERDWWRETLAGAPPLLELPTDFPRPARAGTAAGSYAFALSPALSARLRAVAAEAGATPFMALLAGWGALLGRYAGSRDVVIGTPVAERPHPALEGVAGMFVNTLPLRLAPDEAQGFGAALAAVRETVLAAFARQALPFEQMVEALELPRSWSHNPVFQAMFAWQAGAAPLPRPEGMDWEPMPLPAGDAKLDIALHVRDRSDGFACRIDYRADLFAPGSVAAMAEALVTLLEEAAAAPATPLGRLDALPAAQRARFDIWNDTGRGRTEATLHGLVAAQAAATPDAPALRDGTQHLTYAELEARAGAIAHALRARGIGPGDRVGLCMARGAGLVCALLGILKSGAAYVPLDPRYPAARIAHIAEDAGLALLLGDGSASPAPGVPALDPAGLPDAPAPEPAGSPQDLAYLIYTSGSTGRPKGVAIEHRNAAAFLGWCAEVFSPAELAGVLAATSVCFDLSVFEIFAPLATGGEVLMVEDIFALPEAPFADDVTLINAVPTPMAELMRLGPLPARAATVCLAGEPLPPALADAILRTGTVTRLWNLYGPSEDTTYSTGAPVPGPGAPFGIGGPIAGTQAHVLDEALRPLPQGMPGELWLSGAGVARGYQGQPGLTAERFRPNPFDRDGSAPLLYRTGDRARWRPDGTLACLGRADRQIKLNGFRIEPGETEAALCALPGVSGAVVDAWTDASGHTRLTAWVEGGAEAAALERALAARLPGHLVPTLFAVLERLPRLPNGKLDRGALPAPAPAAQHAPAEPPRPGPEAALALEWEALLGRAPGREDDFFALGGDSILAIQLVSRARAAGLALTPRDVFLHPKLAALAAAAGTVAAAPGGPVNGAVPLTPVQRWFLGRDLPRPEHWNQAVVLRLTRPVAPELLEATLRALPARHDALRARFRRGPSGWQQHYLPEGGAPRLTLLPAPCDAADFAQAAEALQAGFDLGAGPLWGAVLADLGAEGQRLLVAAHHLVVDGVSWRILLADLEACCAALAAGAPLPPPARGTDAGRFVTALAGSPAFDAEQAHWREVCAAPVATLPADGPGGANTEGAAARIEQALSPELTEALLAEAASPRGMRVDEMLAAALALALREATGGALFRIETESHGRDDPAGAADLSGTVGWFTALSPALLEAAPGAGPAEVLAAVRAQMRAPAQGGMGYGVLRHLRGAELPEPEGPVLARLNYLGQVDSLFGARSGTPLFAPAPESPGPLQAPENPRDALLDLQALVHGGRLRLRWIHAPALHRAETVAALAAAQLRHLEALVSLARDGAAPGPAPADFPHMELDQDELDALLRSL